MNKSSRKVKCKKCGESKICYKYKGVNICEDCIEDYMNQNINCSVCKKSFKRKNEIVLETHLKKNFCCNKCSEEFIHEEEEKEKMIEWLKDYFKVEKLPTRIYMQMEDFKNKKHISYSWTFTTLRYIVKIQGRDLEIGTIGIVPYVVDECKQYVFDLNDRKKRAKKTGEENKTRFTDNTVVINMSKIDLKREENIDKMLIKEKDLEGVILW